MFPTARMRRAETYAQWREAALAHDETTGKARWRQVDHSRRYDYRTIRFRLEELREVREAGDMRGLRFYLKEGMHGNMGGMGHPALYREAAFGTKDLITAYIRELREAVEQVAAIPASEMSDQEKLELFERASDCYGRTALMYSGAGSLGPFHLGVTRALLGEGLLPDVLSGASAGSFVAAMVGTHPEDELRELLLDEDLAGLFRMHQQSGEPGDRLTVEDVESMVAGLIPDLTFEEALEHTGRRINISVSPSKLHQQARLLNAVTSPNVCIREAVMASCAIPGIFPAVTLAAKDSKGRRKPYIRSRTWVDGSVTDDQPSGRLARLYGVNHFISSQANPLILWTLRDTAWRDSLGGRLWDVYQSASKEWFKATYPYAIRATKNFYPLNAMTRLGYSVATQDYRADINLLPRQRFWSPSKLLSVLSDEETLGLVREGERVTWPEIERIRNCTEISRTVDRVVTELRASSRTGGGRKSPKKRAKKKVA